MLVWIGDCATRPIATHVTVSEKAVSHTRLTWIGAHAAISDCETNATTVQVASHSQHVAATCSQGTRVGMFTLAVVPTNWLNLHQQQGRTNGFVKWSRVPRKLTVDRSQDHCRDGRADDLNSTRPKRGLGASFILHSAESCFRDK